MRDEISKLWGIAQSAMQLRVSAFLYDLIRTQNVEDTESYAGLLTPPSWDRSRLKTETRLKVGSPATTEAYTHTERRNDSRLPYPKSRNPFHR